MDKEHKIAIIILIAILIILCGYCIYALTGTPSKTLEINDINIKQDEFKIYNLIGHITPLKDFDYLQASITFYDKNGVVIGQSSCAWNTVHAKKDTTLSIGNGLGGVCDGTPAYAVVNFYEDTFMDNPIANATIRFEITDEDNSTSSSDVSSAPANTNNNNDNKYSKADLEAAKNEAYWKGYDDSYDDHYSDDVYTTTDSSSSDSEKDSSSSRDSNVETTTG